MTGVERRRRIAWDRWTILVSSVSFWYLGWLIPALLVWAQSPERSVWIWVVTCVPMAVVLIAGLFTYARAARARKWIDRESLLWSWLRFLGSAVRSSFALSLGAFVGALAGLSLGPNAQLTHLWSAAKVLVVIALLLVALATLALAAQALVYVFRFHAEAMVDLKRWLKDMNVPKRKGLIGWYERSTLLVSICIMFSLLEFAIIMMTVGVTMA